MFEIQSPKAWQDQEKMVSTNTSSKMGRDQVSGSDIWINN